MAVLSQADALKRAMAVAKMAAKRKASGSSKANGVDIYIRERNGSREIRIPWLPEEIEYKSGGTIAATYNIMNKGEVAVPTGAGLASVSWESEFPGANRTDKSMMRGTWQDPSVYHNILEDWKKNQTELNILVTGYPINLDVFLDDYNAKPSGGFGDMAYNVSFTEDLDITITSTTPSSGINQTEEQKRPAETTTAYTIKSGDTLWGIAEKYLGSGAKWETIYNANKDIIEQTAKKYGKSSSNNGWWIYPGVSINIPQS